MSWVSFKTRRGLLKIKPRSQMRWAERNRKVRVVDLGLFVITWWSDDDITHFG